MKKMLLWLCLSSMAGAQTPAQPESKQLLSNDRVLVFTRSIPPHATVPMHKHERDFIVVPLVDARLTSHPEGKPDVAVVLHAGEPDFRKGDHSHSETNEGDTAARLTRIEFLYSQGEAKKLDTPTSHFCNQGSKTACITERYLFCTDKVCVCSVEFGPGAISEVHRHATPHMLVALNDLEMRDEQPGKPAEQRSLKAGEVAYLPAGINHALVNGPKAARFITVVWK